METLNLTRKRIKNTKETVEFDHLLQCGSPTTFDDFDLLASILSNLGYLLRKVCLSKVKSPF